MKSFKTYAAAIVLMAITLTSSAYHHQPVTALNFSVRVNAMAMGKSIMFRTPGSLARQAGGDKCHKYKGMQVAGIVLLSVGVPTIVGGGVLVNLGIRNAINEGDDWTTANLIVGGSLMTVFGIAMTATGTALTIVGSVKKHKYCNSGSARHFYISPARRGMGLACRF